MPFDGGEFSRSPGPWPPTPVPAGPRPVPATRPRGLLPGGPGRRGARSPIPERPGAAEATAAHLSRAARAPIEAEETWTRGAHRTPGGGRCAVGAPRAAAVRAGWREARATEKARTSLLAAARERGFGGIEAMDDGSGHAEVLAAFDAVPRGAAPIARAVSPPPPSGRGLPEARAPTEAGPRRALARFARLRRSCPCGPRNRFVPAPLREWAARVRPRRQQERRTVADMSGIREHMEVVGSDGGHVGTVDKVEGQRIKLTKQDPAAGGEHHYVDTAFVAGVEGGKLRLDVPAAEAKKTATDWM